MQDIHGQWTLSTGTPWRAGLGFIFSEEPSLVAMSGHKDGISGRGAEAGDKLDYQEQAHRWETPRLREQVHRWEIL